MADTYAGGSRNDDQEGARPVENPAMAPGGAGNQPVPYMPPPPGVPPNEPPPPGRAPPTGVTGEPGLQLALPPDGDG
jgi:hypothetical protein